MNRAILTIIYVLLYVIAFNVYIYLLSHGMLGQSERRLMYYYITAIMTIVCWVDLKNITKTDHHGFFNDIAFGSIVANYILNVLNHHGIFNSNGANLFLWFNGLIFANTLIIFTCMKRHGFINK